MHPASRLKRVSGADERRCPGRYQASFAPSTWTMFILVLSYCSRCDQQQHYQGSNLAAFHLRFRRECHYLALQEIFDDVGLVEGQGAANCLYLLLLVLGLNSSVSFSHRYRRRRPIHYLLGLHQKTRRWFYLQPGRSYLWLLERLRR